MSHRSLRCASVLLASLLAGVLVSCSSTTNLSGPGSGVSLPSSTTEVATTAVATTAAVTTDVETTLPSSTEPPATEPTATDPPATEPPATEPSATEPAGTTAASGPLAPCPGPQAIPVAATDRVTIAGDIDGDTQPDQVTSYSLDGVPHIHATLFTGRDSDVTIPLGFADTVSISFEDFDHSLGAAVPPPVAVLAIGQGNAGSAFVAFLTLTIRYCLRQWTLADQPFSIRISQQGPYTGLVCDGAAGSIHYVEVTAEQRADGRWRVQQRAITHNFTRVTLTPLDPLVVDDGPDVPHQYGDIVGCGHPPLFP